MTRRGWNALIPLPADQGAAITSALLLNLAYPPFHLLLPSFVCLVPAVVALERGAGDPSTLRRQVLLGFWFGLVANALTLHWMAAALWRFERWQVLGFVAAVLWLAAATGAAFASVGWVRRRTGLPMVLIFPVCWTMLEWFLAHLGPISFTWLGLGTSLTGYPLVVQVADVAGARGVTFLLAAANSALAVAWLTRHEPRRAGRLVSAVALGCAAALFYGLFRVRSLDQRILSRVAVVGTDVAPHEKWNPAWSDTAVAQALELSQVAARQGADLIAWPETALPGALLYHPEWEGAIARLARTASASVVVGGLDGVPQRDGTLRTHNAAFLFAPTGRRAGAPYHKERLVPLFEFGNGIQGGEPGPVFETLHGRIGVVICGEMTFEVVARSYRRRGAEALVNLANDAWFAVSTGPHQHVAHLVMRAIETRSGIARAANRGISEIVDPAGRVRRRLPPESRGVAIGFLGTTAGVPVYVRLGDWVGRLSLAGTVLLLTVAGWRPRAVATERSCANNRPRQW